MENLIVIDDTTFAIVNRNGAYEPLAVDPDREEWDLRVDFAGNVRRRSERDEVSE